MQMPYSGDHMVMSLSSGTKIIFCNECRQLAKQAMRIAVHMLTGRHMLLRAFLPSNLLIKR